MTIIIPFLGIMLLFNIESTNLFTLSPIFLDDIGVTNGKSFSLTNLYFTYFGLCFLGLASLLFTALCPTTIRSEPSHTQFVSQTPEGQTPVQSKEQLNSLFEYHYRFFDPNDRFADAIESHEYPIDVQINFLNLIEAIYAETAFPEDEDTTGYADPNELMDPLTATGYLDFSGVGIVMYRQIAAEKMYWIPFWEAAPRLSKDIAYTYFKVLDASRFKARVTIFLLYACGMFVTAIPTIKTFYLIAMNTLF